MWTWLNRLAFAPHVAPKTNLKTRTPVCTRPRRLGLEWLEEREMPALSITFNYSLDTNGFFNDPTRRAILEQAASDLTGRVTSSMAAISPSGGNNWSATFFNPATGGQATVGNPTIAADTIVVYAGGRDLSGTEAGAGGNGGYSAAGNQAWFDAIKGRGTGGYALWGGSLAFDTNGTNWYFGSSAAGIGSNQVDFYSVAVHEIGHVLGIGTAQQWFGNVSGGTFRGSNASAVYGGAVPVYGDSAHWANNLTINGSQAAMDPILPSGTRVGFTSLDFAALKDIGWGIDGTPTPGGTPTPAPAAPTPPAATPVPLGSPTLQVTASPTGGAGSSRLVVLTGSADGTAQVFTAGSDGNLIAVGGKFTPFPGWTGTIRTVVADFNGDGYSDFAYGTGPGADALVRIVNGATGNDLVSPTSVLDGFRGGIFLAAGDVNRDGAAELAVSADAGGGTRVSVFQVSNGQLAIKANFIAFGDPVFRGGSRIAMGDVNRDGYADLVVGAGVGGGPRVAIYDGNSIFSGTPRSLVPDFFALDPDLRSGVFVTVGDLDGDGYADVIYSTGNSGGPRVKILSGESITHNNGVNPYYLPAMADLFVLNPDDRQGIRVAARDLDGDGKAELIIGSGSPDIDVVRVIPFSQLGRPTTPLQNPFANPATIEGVYVG